MEYSIHGPFKITRFTGYNNKKAGVDYTNKTKKIFWEAIGKELSSACGCYLFVIKASKGFKPWYAGLAEKRSFEEECFTHQKISIYDYVLSNCGNGTPHLFLIAKRTKNGKLVTPSINGHKDIRYLETMLIGTAIEKNPKLMNIQKTKYLKEMCVPGLLNTPKRPPKHSESEFKKAIK
jgi:hypothetical protein